jgi:hypothetical protein
MVLTACSLMDVICSEEGLDKKDWELCSHFTLTTQNTDGIQELVPKKSRLVVLRFSGFQAKGFRAQFNHTEMKNLQTNR